MSSMASLTLAVAVVVAAAGDPPPPTAPPPTAPPTTATTTAGATIRVGSKAFTEGVILGEIATLLAQRAGHQAEHKRQLGGTRLVFAALEKGDIDVYAEYTGTLASELLMVPARHDAIRAALVERQLAMTAPLGFNNTYGLAMREDTAQQLGIRFISDLAAHPELEYGVSNEFLDRKDGWPSLSVEYGLTKAAVRGLDHDVSYQAVVSGAVAVTDCYTTDAEIAHYGLRVLVDDRGHFPRYEAVYLYRAGALPDDVVAALGALERRISEREMAQLNARVRIDKRDEVSVAAAFLSEELDVDGVAAAPTETRPARILRRTVEHLWLVAAALAFSLPVALPIGIVVARRRRLGQAVLSVVGIIQTIPSIALLVLFVPLLGIGSVPAIVAMVLYGLLPIVGSTYAGLTGIAPALQESAAALGLTPRARLVSIELPLASPSILSGIQTSAVISVGTATIGALVGAGGYGQSILTGVRLADSGLILEGALPAATMAVVIQLAFAALQRVIVPRGLRLE